MSSDNGGASGSTSDTPRKKHRSKTGLPIVSTGPVLPALCIIFKTKDKIITVGGKHQKDRLSQAETFSAGKHTHTHTHTHTASVQTIPRHSGGLNRVFT